MRNPLLSTLLGGAAIAALSACSAESDSSEGRMADAMMAQPQIADSGEMAGAQDTDMTDAKMPANDWAAKQKMGSDEAPSKEASLADEASVETSSKKPALKDLKQVVTGTAASFPAPKMDSPTSGGTQVAVLAGGCFWTQEAVFEHIKGVKSVVSGYAGGTAETATYEQVATRNTGHAESIRITYDPSQISYGHLLKIFFAAAHDPTQVNRQGPDIGQDYRSAIFPQNAQQRKVASSYIAQLGKTDAFGKPIATKIESGTFYPAEDRHQNFVERNPRHPYVVAWDVPKLHQLKKAFPADWRNSTTS